MLDKNNQNLEMLVFFSVMLAWTSYNTMIMWGEKQLDFENVGFFLEAMLAWTLCNTMYYWRKKS
jgi:hypothetical protein